MAQNEAKAMKYPGGLTVALIPAYNEEGTVAKVVIKTKLFVDKVVVCDDGSTDDTGLIAKELGADVLRHNRNLGKGQALRSLVAEAKRLGAAAVVTLDADDQHDPADIPEILAPIWSGEADLVVGARSMKFPDMPIDRVLGNKVIDAVSGATSGTGVNDTQSGFRAYSRKALEFVEFTGHGMTVESQTIIEAAQAGLRIKEIPVSTRYWGVRAKRSRFSHFSEVFDYLLSRTIVGNPLTYLGVPGVIAIVVGLVFGFQVAEIYIQQHQIALGTGLLSISLVLIGAITVSTSLILKLLSVRLRR